VISEAASQPSANVRHRHATCDWGDVSEDDGWLNDEALDQGERLLSAYHTANGEKIWIITEADRSATTMLMPEEH